MICSICNSATTLITDDTYQCVNCLHIYRDLVSDNSLYTTGKYREEHKIQDLEKRLKWTSNIIGVISEAINNSTSILEVGSGDGVLTKQLISLGKQVSCCELDPFIVDKYPDLKVYVGDFTELNIPKHDLYIGMDVLEHIKNPNKFIEKCNCSHLVLQIPINRHLGTPKTKPDGHYHYFSSRSIQILLNKFNFNIDKMHMCPKGFSANGEELLILASKNEL